MSGEFESRLNGVKHDLKELMPVRCRDCTKTEIDVSQLALRVVKSEMQMEEAVSVTEKRAQDVWSKCNGGRHPDGCFGGFDECRYGMMS